MNDCFKSYGYWDDVIESDEEDGYSIEERLVAKYLKDNEENMKYWFPNTVCAYVILKKRKKF